MEPEFGGFGGFASGGSEGAGSCVDRWSKAKTLRGRVHHTSISGHLEPADVARMVLSSALARPRAGRGPGAKHSSDVSLQKVIPP